MNVSVATGAGENSRVAVGVSNGEGMNASVNAIMVGVLLGIFARKKSSTIEDDNKAEIIVPTTVIIPTVITPICVIFATVIVESSFFPAGRLGSAFLLRFDLFDMDASHSS